MKGQSAMEGRSPELERDGGSKPRAGAGVRSEGSELGSERETREGEEKMAEGTTVHPILCTRYITHPTL